MSTLGVTEPPPAPRPRGLLKSFNGSMLLLMSSKPSSSTETYETCDPERRNQAQASGSRGSSLLRPSDLFSRSSASSFGSRGSFSGLFPMRPGSAPLESDGPGSREQSPRTSLTRYNEGSVEDEPREVRKSLSSALVNSIKKTRKDIGKKLFGATTSDKRSNLGQAAPYEPVIADFDQTPSRSNTPPTAPPPSTGIDEPMATTLPSFIKVIKPAAATPVNATPSLNSMMPTPKDSARSISPTKAVQTRSKLIHEKEIPRSTVTTRNTPSDSMRTTSSATISSAIVSPLSPANGTTEEKETEGDRNDILKAADAETIKVLTSRIGDVDAAKAVVRVARSAESWTREQTNRLLISPETIPAPNLASIIRTEGSSNKDVGTDDEDEDEDNAEVNYTRLFYGEKRPKIALDRYLGRLVRYLDSFCETSGGVGSMGILSLAGAACLIDRLATKTSFVLDPMNTHRVLMVATLIAFKMLDDEPCTNDYYANVGGVELKELNALEVTFLKAIDFDTIIRAREMERALSEYILPEPAHAIFNEWFENDT